MVLTLQVGPTQDGGWWCRALELPQVFARAETRELVVEEARREALWEVAERRRGTAPWPSVELVVVDVEATHLRPPPRGATRGL